MAGRGADDSGSREDTTGAGLYVHIPFCRSVCPYCDFAVTIAGEERRKDFLESLSREIVLWAGWDEDIDTVYLGGGTPSSLEPRVLEGILEGLRGSLPVAPDARLFLEVNPEDVRREAVAAWRELGFGTISLGVQSFDDDDLRFLGRRHTARDARRALDALLGGGFETVSVDLIFGLPGRTVRSWRRQLDETLRLGPDHLSCYQLTIHDGTVFGRRAARGELREVDGDRQAELLLITHRVLADAGFEGYEVSSFARGPEHRSLHNLKYWTHRPYLGLGPSAHSYRAGRRWWNARKLRLWSRALVSGDSPVVGSEQLTPDQLALEALLLGLRTRDGIDLRRLEEWLGLDLLGDQRARLEGWLESGHLESYGDYERLRPTVAGMAVADAIAASLAP